jgi:hypothetical protein
VDTQTAIASFEASEDRRRATRFARLARSPAAAVGAGNTSDGDAPSNDTTASSVSPNPITPAVERRVYTPADLREIGNTTLSVTPASSSEGWERVRLRCPPTLFNYRNANLDGSSDMRDDSDPPPPSKSGATSGPSGENSQPQESAHEDSTPEADGRVSSLSPSSSPESSARRTDTHAPWLDEDQIRTADVAAVAQRASTAGAAGALDSQGSAEGGEESSEEPNIETNQSGAKQEDSEGDAELPSSCSNRSSHSPSCELASSSSSSGAAAAKFGFSKQQQPQPSNSSQEEEEEEKGGQEEDRLEHDSTDPRHRYQDEGPLVSSHPEEVGDEVDEDFNADSKEIDYPESESESGSETEESQRSDD